MELLAKLFKLVKGPWQWLILWLFHDKFIVGVVGIVLNDRNEVLLCRHRFWKDGSWGLPGGYANKNETLEACLAREIKEETGLAIDNISLHKLVSGYKLRLEAYYVAQATSDNFTLDNQEILEAQFFSLDNLPVALLTSQHHPHFGAP
jgi:ADP-ribose pyrophosphatase YjhB (NUDIX family)